MSENNNQNDNLQPVYFTQKQLTQFKRELKKAGGFDELMFEKKALERGEIAKHPNKEEYREQFLIKNYEALRPYFTTDVPYTFWAKLYKAVTEKYPKVK